MYSLSIGRQTALYVSVLSSFSRDTVRCCCRRRFGVSPPPPPNTSTGIWQVDSVHRFDPSTPRPRDTPGCINYAVNEIGYMGLYVYKTGPYLEVEKAASERVVCGPGPLPAEVGALLHQGNRVNRAGIANLQRSNMRMRVDLCMYMYVVATQLRVGKWTAADRSDKKASRRSSGSSRSRNYERSTPRANHLLFQCVRTSVARRQQRGRQAS